MHRENPRLRVAACRSRSKDSHTVFKFPPSSAAAPPPRNRGGLFQPRRHGGPPARRGLARELRHAGAAPLLQGGGVPHRPRRAAPGRARAHDRSCRRGGTCREHPHAQPRPPQAGAGHPDINVSHRLAARRLPGPARCPEDLPAALGRESSASPSARVVGGVLSAMPPVLLLAPR